MPIHIIACIFQYKNRLAIGRDNSLLVKISQDLKRFRELTTKTIVVMGRKTWDSLPTTHKPLTNRINIILTHDKSLTNPLPMLGYLQYNTAYFTTFEWFTDFYKAYCPKVFIIGGAEIYKQCMDLNPEYIFLTEVYNYTGSEPNVFMDKIPYTYKLYEFSPRHRDETSDLEYRFLNYHLEPHHQSQEYKYLDLCKYVLQYGNERPDRTGVGTIGIFGTQLHFDISEEIPLLTTKRVAWKHCVEELLWFLRGDTDAKILQQRGVRIWNGNTSRDFLDSRGLNHYDEGILGPGYGWCWRYFGAPYDQKFANTSNGRPTGGMDQIQYVLNELQNNPFSRRILVSAWNPTQMDEIALMPCHYSFQFYVEEIQHQKYLSCHFIMRSNDLGCGLSFNLLSYAVLTYIIALKCDMKPKNLVYSCSDVHIYNTHIEALQNQIQRTPTVAPKLVVNPKVKEKSFEEMCIKDFDIVGYYPDPYIKMEMAV